LKSFAARAQTVPSSHAQRQARGRASRPWPAGFDQTKPQMLYSSDPQPYGSGFPLNVKGYSRDPSFLFPDLRTQTPARRVINRQDVHRRRPDGLRTTRTEVCEPHFPRSSHEGALPEKHRRWAWAKSTFPATFTKPNPRQPSVNTGDQEGSASIDQDLPTRQPQDPFQNRHTRPLFDPE
jgi:hypothetical protein